MRYLIIIFLLLAGGVVAAPTISLEKPPPEVNQNYTVLQYDAQISVNTLSEDMISLGADSKKAVEIQKYFEGKKEYLTIQEWKEYVRVLDIAIRKTYTKDIGEITAEKLNWFINNKVE